MIKQALVKRGGAGLLAGLLSGLISGLFVEPVPNPGWQLVIYAFLGISFGLLVGPRIATAGSSLVWGEAVGLLWWFVGSLTLIPWLSGEGFNWTISTVQSRFPYLVAQIVSFGTVLGLSYYLSHQVLKRLLPAVDTEDFPERRIPAQQRLPVSVQAIIFGGIGGLLGSWVFARGIESAEFFPLVAGIMGSNSMTIGQVLHYLIGITIGVSFGVLFCRDIQGVGSGLVWGMNYGLLWWVIGPLTLLPLLLDMSTMPDWSLAAAQAAFAPLIAHMLYGAMVGFFYALANKLWQVLFVDSDPLNRTRESVGSRGVRGILTGIVSGIVGGLLFTIVMLGIGFLPYVANLIGSHSILVGFAVHLIISSIVGITYGMLFQRAAFSYGSGLGWGLVYGLLWWMLGQLTLYFVILRQPVDWSLTAVAPFYPALIGHLLYGTGLGLVFQYLARRYDIELSGRVRGGGSMRANLSHRGAEGTPASALWAVTLALGVMIPVLLST